MKKSDIAANIIKIIFYEIFMMFVLPFVLSGSSFTWLDMYNDVPFANLVGSNGDAKWVFSAADTYVKLCEKEHAFLKDGVYIGSAVYSDEAYPKDGSPEGLYKILNLFAGGPHVYYCVIIKDGKPIQAYQSSNAENACFCGLFSVRLGTRHNS